MSDRTDADATYNQDEVKKLLITRFSADWHGLVLAALLLSGLACATSVAAQQASASGPNPSAADADGTIGRGRILLVLPFDNLTDASEGASSAKPGLPTATTTATNGQASLDWLREAAPEVLDSRFTSAGFLPLSRQDRLYALDHLGLPEGFQPSRATALRLAQTLDADYFVIGSYKAVGTTLTLKARIVDVSKLHISEEVTETGEIGKLIALLNSLAWQLTRKLDPQFGVAEETFRAAGAKIRLDAFEQFIRGLTEHEAAERLKHLKKATDLSPDFTEAWLETGRLQFETQEYEQAAVAFGKVTRGDPSELESGFYRGLSLMFTGNYPKAEDAFASIARVLPLPEVVNDQAVASSRRGHDAVALFKQAVAADPTDADYHFNLAVSLHAHGDKNEALREIAQSLRLKPNDSEAKAAEAAWKSAGASSQSTNAGGIGNALLGPDPGSVEPLERIKRSYNGAAFRQAALMLDQMEAAQLAALPKGERASHLSRSAHDKLDRGLLLEAEREYQAALAADDQSFEAHAGLAEVRERAGDADAARKEAQASNQRKPNLEAYMVLARLDLAANRLPEARDEVAEALKMDGSSRAAKDLHKAVDARMAVPVAAKPDASAKP